MPTVLRTAEMGGTQRKLLCALLLALSALQCEATLELVMTIHRHGARTVLFKNATTLSEGGALLTTQGENQTFGVGQGFRRRYLDPTFCAVTQTCVNGLADGRYDGTQVRSISSSFDRTLASAYGFLQGAFPRNATDTFLAAKPIPVFSIPTADDFLIRAYENCPAYLTAMNAWFQSPEFAAKENASQPLLTSLQTSLGKPVKLNDFWNVFDDLNTQRDAILVGGNGALTSVMQEPTWSQVVDLANWLEANRYRRSLTGNLLGGSLLNELLVRLQARRINSQPEAERIIEYSAHYPTQLSLMSALNLTANATFFNTKIPNYAAQILIELHSNAPPAIATGQALSGYSWAVRMLTQDGLDAPYVPVTLPCAGASAEQLAGPGSCSLDDFLSYAQAQAISTQGLWCQLCANTAMKSCIAIRFQPNADNLATYVASLNKTSNAYFNITTVATPPGFACP